MQMHTFEAHRIFDAQVPIQTSERECMLQSSSSGLWAVIMSAPALLAVAAMLHLETATAL